MNPGLFMRAVLKDAEGPQGDGRGQGGLSFFRSGHGLRLGCMPWLCCAIKRWKIFEGLLRGTRLSCGGGGSVMFSGIVEEVGVVEGLKPTPGGARLVVRSSLGS